jgi:dienelactone hydrolase
MKKFLVLLALVLAGVRTAAGQSMPNGEFLEAKGATAAVILAHGRAQGPDGWVVGRLRRAIAAQAGMHTLSLQMPRLASPDYHAYAATFPDAYNTLQLAIDYLVRERQVQRIYVMGYSMGARMTTAFLASRPLPEVAGYIGVGVLEGGGSLLDANENIRKLTVPVIDCYADSTALDLVSAQKRQPLVGERYRQVLMPGANHSFAGHERALSKVIVEWLKEQEAQR